jgi:PhnB protein
MTVNPVPAGYHAVTPYLIVDGANKVIEFAAAAFGAKVLFRMPRPDGTVAHAELEIGDSRVMVADSSAEWTAMPAMVHLYVPDADAAYTHALAAGATSVREPRNEFYGDRSAAVKDVAGKFWHVATHVEDVAPEELDRRAAAASH